MKLASSKKAERVKKINKFPSQKSRVFGKK